MVIIIKTTNAIKNSYWVGHLSQSLDELKETAESNSQDKDKSFGATTLLKPRVAWAKMAEGNLAHRYNSVTRSVALAPGTPRICACKQRWHVVCWSQILTCAYYVCCGTLCQSRGEWRPRQLPQKFNSSYQTNTGDSAPQHTNRQVIQVWKTQTKTSTQKQAK